MKIHSDGIVTALILEKGEPVHESLKQAAKELKLPGAFVTGIGVIEDVTVAFFQIESKSYKEISPAGPIELLALTAVSAGVAMNLLFTCMLFWDSKTVLLWEDIF
jgi:predicted DNA-binding protein with PD1-like motif